MLSTLPSHSQHNKRMFFQHISCSIQTMSSPFFIHSLFPSKTPSVNIPSSFFSFSSKSFFGIGEVEDKKSYFDFSQRCSSGSAISKPQTKESPEVFQGGLPKLKWQEIVEDDIDEEIAPKVWRTEKIEELVIVVKTILNSLEDGEISISAYDTAWVALIEDINGNGGPQFPSSLEWIANNQLPDGSWGDSQLFSAHDRIINTLACVIALRSWNVHPDKCERGMAFFRENSSKIENENADHMTIGFEVAFPSLLEIARSLNIEVANDSTILKDIFAKRNLKLARIPREIMHKVPTTLLHSLEGMSGSLLDWKALLKLQSQDGSFLFSPASTAFAFIHTKDENCLKYLKKVTGKFNGGVPNVYPVDLFEHIWIVDRLERLGFSRYFQQEINDCMNYIYRYWTEKGISWARNSEVQDIDDTSMGFRLLRLHGREVSANVFKHFKRNGEFFGFAGQSTQAVTGMYSLYRASQVLFPGEKILEDANTFSAKFLRERQAANQLTDKWIRTKNLADEVGYALDVPWHASLPRVETRFYIEQYGGDDDIWIGKTLYRMPYVNNDTFLELAKLDYNNCQALHLTEWKEIQKWYSDRRLDEFGFSRKDLLIAYFVAAANTFEPEKSKQRLAWAKTKALLETITSSITDEDTRKAFVNKFTHHIYGDCSLGWRLNKDKTGQGLVGTLVETIDQISWDIYVSHNHEIGYEMFQAWEKWFSSWQCEGDRCEGQAELLVQTINLSAGLFLSGELLLNPRYQRLIELTNRVCYRLHRIQKDKAHERGNWDRNTYSTTPPEVESEMQELVQLVLQKSSNGTDSNIKNTFLTVAKSFYYAAFCDPRTINFHIAKVLFEKVI